MAAGFFDVIRKILGWKSSVPVAPATVSTRYILEGCQSAAFIVRSTDDSNFVLEGSDSDNLIIKGA